MANNSRKILSFLVAIAMILSINTSFASKTTGTVHLYQSDVLMKGNNPEFEDKESVHIGIVNFSPGTYDVVVKSPASNESILGSGQISVGETGRSFFNLYELTEFTNTENESGVYTVTVGSSKSKSFKVILTDIEPDYWKVTFEAGSNGSLTGVIEFNNILDGTNWEEAVTVPTPVPSTEYQFDGWTPSPFPETVEQDLAFTASFSLIQIDPEDPTPQDIRADRLIKEEGFIPIANREELWMIWQSFPEGQLFGEGTKWEGQYITSGLTGKYVLVKDIDLEYKTWSMIGSPVYPFAGTFDGNDYKIMDLITSNQGYGNYFGLFGYVDGGLIRNVVISDPIIDGYDYTGALAGYIKDSRISNIKIIIIDEPDSVVLGSYHVGGVIGYSENSIVENVYNEVSVGGASSTGGIVGLNGVESGESTSMIIDAVNIGTVYGSSGVGGITGSNYGVIRRALNRGDVLGEASVGGITGFSYGGWLVDRYSIEQSANTGNVEGDSLVGGIAGFVEIEKMTDIYNTGTVEGVYYVGGVIGLFSISEAENLYSSALSISNVGSLVGEVSVYGSIINGYYNIDLYDGLFGEGVGLNNDQMTEASSFAGFDFDDVWDIIPGESYPFLIWQEDLYVPLKVELP